MTIRNAGTGAALTVPAGNVGIGTTAPAAKLDVNGSAIIRGGLLRQTFGDSGAATQWVKLGRWTAAQQGRNATIRLEGGNGFNAIFDQISAVEIHLRTSNAVSVDANGFCASAVYQVLGRNPIVTAVKLVGNAAGCSATVYDVYVNAQTFTGVGSFFTVDADASTTWTTDAQFGVADPGSASSSVYIVTAETTLSNNFYVNGNVGVGTTAPTQALHVSGSVQIDGDIYGGKYGGTRSIWRFSTTDPNYGIFYTEASPDIISFSPQGGGSATPAMAIVGSSVGIGTTNPGALLDVAGNIRMSGAGPEFEMNAGGPRLRVPAGNTLAFHTGGGFGTTTNERMRIDSAGNVGIGTGAPAEKLDVTGNIKASGDLNSGAGQGFKIRRGTATCTINLATQTGSGAVCAVNYGYTFASPPMVTATNTNPGSWRDGVIINISAKTATGFSFYFFNAANTTATGDMIVDWIAIGQ